MAVGTDLSAQSGRMNSPLQITEFIGQAQNVGANSFAHDLTVMRVKLAGHMNPCTFRLKPLALSEAEGVVRTNSRIKPAVSIMNNPG